MGYLVPKPFLSKNSSGEISIIAAGDKEVHTIPLGICLKVSVRARGEFKLGDCVVVVQHVTYEAKGTSCRVNKVNQEDKMYLWSDQIIPRLK